jgi:cytochrome b subunit of formate dehydrogenase
LRLSISTRLEQRAGRDGLTIGNFNAGQKVNAVFVGAIIVIMLATGVVMYWFSPWPLSWRTSATFVHEWLAIAVFVVALGHMVVGHDQLSNVLGGWIPLRQRAADGRSLPGARPGRASGRR